jgi:hypothetical protein
VCIPLLVLCITLTSLKHEYVIFSTGRAVLYPLVFYSRRKDWKSKYQNVIVLRDGPVTGSCEYGNEISDSIKDRKFIPRWVTLSFS